MGVFHFKGVTLAVVAAAGELPRGIFGGHHATIDVKITGGAVARGVFFRGGKPGVVHMIGAASTLAWGDLRDYAVVVVVAIIDNGGAQGVDHCGHAFEAVVAVLPEGRFETGDTAEVFTAVLKQSI